MAGEELPCRLVENVHAAVLIGGEQRAWRIVDDRGKIAHLLRLMCVAQLKRLQRMVERLPEHVEPAAARVGEALRIIVETYRFDEARDEEIGPPNEVPQACERDGGDDRGDDEAGAHARRLQRLDDEEDGTDEEKSSPGKSEFELASKVHASPSAGTAHRGLVRVPRRQAKY